MKATFVLCAALLATVALVAPTKADQYPYWPQAPSAYGPGFYTTNYCGMTYGPHYYLRPSFAPYSGIQPNCAMGSFGSQGSPTFPHHAFARSPRDFFMTMD